MAGRVWKGNISTLFFFFFELGCPESMLSYLGSTSADGFLNLAKMKQDEPLGLDAPTTVNLSTTPIKAIYH